MKGCLLIHGFTGSPYEVQPLTDALRTDSTHIVRVFTLPGHGTHDTLRYVHWREWVKEAEREYVTLARKCTSVDVIGFSMGGLLAAHLAAHYPVKKLVLLSAAVYYWNPGQMLRNISEVMRGGDNGLYSLGEQMKRYRRRIRQTPPSAVLQFRRMVRHGRAVLPHVRCPVLIMQGEKDDLIPIKSAPYIYEHIGSTDKTIRYLDQSRHVLCHDCQQKEVVDAVRAFLRRDNDNEETTTEDQNDQKNSVPLHNHRSDRNKQHAQTKRSNSRHDMQADMHDDEQDNDGHYLRHRAERLWPRSIFYGPRQSSNVRIGILLIHGFTGSTLELRPLADHVYAQDWANRDCVVHAPLLKGHGDTPEAMAETSWVDWFASALDGYDRLREAGCQHIVPIGLSMGGLLAFKVAQHRPVRGIASLCAPVKVRDKRMGLARYVQGVMPYKRRWGKKASHIEREVFVYERTPLSAVVSLQHLMQNAYDMLPSITEPVFIAQSKRDETVDPCSGDMIHARIASTDKQLVVFEKSTHIITLDHEQSQLFEKVTAFIEHVTNDFAAQTDTERMNVD